MEFRYLGRLEVMLQGRTVPVTGKRQRRLLALLVADAGEVVSMDRLAETVLERPSDAAASSTLQSHVSVLRRTLGVDGVARIVTHPRGYRFEPGPDDLIDGREFETAVIAARAALAAGDAAQAHRILDEGLLWWRGAPLPELDDALETHPLVVRMESLHLDAVEARADALLALGQPAAVVSDLEPVARRHPLRESLWERLALAYYRSGRQNDALRALESVRVALSRELGIEPGPMLRRLLDDILAQRPELEADPAPAEGSFRGIRAARRTVAGERAGEDDPAFIGRHHELQAARRALDRAGEGLGSLILITGRSGMGKTRLATEMVRRAGRGGAAWGSATPDGGVPTLWPWIQVLRSLLDAGSPADRLRWCGDAAGLARVERLVAPEPRPADSEQDPFNPLNAESARFRLFDTVTQILRRRSADSPLLVVLDDLHWADHSSQRLLAHAAGQLQSAPVVLVVTYRLQSSDPSDGLPDTLAALARVVGKELFELAQLTGPEVGELVLARTGRDPTADARADIERLSGGVPFFVTELARQVRPDGSLAPGVPSGAQDALRFRLRALPAAVTGLMELAAVSGFRFGLEDLGVEAGGAGPGSALKRAIDAAVDADLLEAATDGGDWAFRHHIVHHAMLDLIDPGRQAALHLMVGRSLEVRPEVARARVAHHYVLGAGAGGADRAIELCREAARDALEATGYEEAVGLLETAVSLAETHGQPIELQLDLRIELGKACWWLADPERARRELLHTAGLAREAGLTHQLGRAVLGYGGTSNSVFFPQTGTALPEHVELLRETLQILEAQDRPNPWLMVRILAQLGVALYWVPGGLAEADTLSRRALDIASRQQDPTTLGYALFHRYLAAWGPDTLAERLALSPALAELRGATETEVDVWNRRVREVVALMELGHLEAVQETLAVIEGLSAGMGWPSMRAMPAFYRAALRLFRGELAACEDAINFAFEMAQESGDLDAIQSYGVQLTMLRRDEGRIAEMIPALEQQSQAFPAVPTWAVALALGLCDLGRTDAARAALASVGPPDELPRDFQWLCGMAMWSEVAAALSDAEAGAQLYRLMAPYSGRNVLTSTAIAAWGSSDRYIGLAAAAHGEHGLAEAHLRAAIDHNAAMGATPWKLRSTRDLARVIRTVGGPSGRAEADALTTAYRSEAAAIGMALT